MFDDPFVETGVDGRHYYGEERLVAAGCVGDRLVAVVHTQRDDVIRVFSARRAATHERRAFEDGTL
ncbi:MAG: BrnT family toxin [Candidatus Poribacteria bacterium]